MRPGRTGLLPPGSDLEDPDPSSPEDREELSPLDLLVLPPGLHNLSFVMICIKMPFKESLYDGLNYS